MLRWTLALTAGLVLGLATAAPAAGIPLVDASGASIGKVKVKLEKGAVTVKATDLAALPTDVDTGDTVFTAYLYKAYLTSTADPAVEIFLGDLWPNRKAKGAVKTKLKGDLSGLGFDQVVVVAFSKDATEAFDVATAALQ